MITRRSLYHTGPQTADLLGVVRLMRRGPAPLGPISRPSQTACAVVGEGDLRAENLSQDPQSPADAGGSGAQL